MSSTDPNPSDPADPVADLVARVILALECDGRAAADALLDAEPRHAAAARVRLDALRAAGMLRDADDAPPARIGPFRILERLGRGGMGEVFLAEQREPVQRRIALKVVRAGMDSREVLARFAAERQTLALFDHPNIAKVLDAGMTADGRPYLAMEYVPGQPITKYCDERGLNTEQRVSLFTDVCETIQHAHQHGILHRDLKPSNILVVDRGNEPWPKIIDFGVAKSTQGRLAEHTLYTEVGRLLGTPEYMSPEQAQNRVTLDTRTDVYSLGAVLYELLTGSLPIDSARLRTVGQGEMERILLEEEPPTPSTRISTLGESAGDVAARRRTDPGALRRRLRGDLDWITMKALERDRNRRYASADALAADLKRHLAFEPVTAGPPGAWYRLSRFARRHRAASLAAVSIVAALLIGLILSISFWREARVAQLREAAARAEAEDAFEAAIRAADEILVEVGGDRLRRFAGLAEERRRLLDGGLAFCRSVVDRLPAGSRHESALGLVQSRIAWFQSELGLDEQALATLDAIRFPPGEGDDVLELRIAAGGVRGLVCEKVGDRQGALAGRRSAVEAAHALAARHPGSARDATRVATELGRLAHAMRSADTAGNETALLYEEAARTAREQLDRSDIGPQGLPDLLHVLADYADWLVERGEPTRARDVLDALESYLRRFIEQLPDDTRLREQLAPTLESRAHALTLSADFDAAEKDAREAVAIRDALVRQLPGDLTQSAALAAAKATLAKILINGFRYRDALELLRDAVAIHERRLAIEPDSVRVKLDLTWILSEFAQATLDWAALKPDLALDEAIASAERAEAIAAGLTGRDDLDAQGEHTIARQEFTSSQLAEKRGDLDSAAEHVERAIAASDRAIARLPDQVPLQIARIVELRAAGRIRFAQADPTAAERYLARAIEAEDGLRAKGVRYLDSDGRLRDILMMYADACLAIDDLDGAERAVTRGGSLTPDQPITSRLACPRYLAIARKLVDPTARDRVLRLALECATTAHEVLVERFSQGGGAQGLSYQITLYDVLTQLAAVHDARGETSECDRLGEQFVSIARALAKDPGRDRDRARLAAAYEQLIGYRVARGDIDGANALRARQATDLSGR
ncbi:MAG: serine/threonine protein kinase [Planctomycetes bacterium]|nr:serine/threonine protein kinase [Planctomycetota bacterium]